MIVGLKTNFKRDKKELFFYNFSNRGFIRI